MDFRIETLPERKVTGKCLKMSFTNDRTSELWRSFIPKRSEIINKVSSDLISMKIFGSSFDFENIRPDAVFEKWAAAEVPDFTNVPEGLETYIIPEGLYAVFSYRGNPAEGDAFFKQIFLEWLPSSPYAIDDRPHFEILGEKYKNNDPSSEEEIFIPLKLRS